jgi:hypothetical protein
VSSLTPPLLIEVPGLVQALQSTVEGLNHSLSWLGTGTSIKSGGVKLITFLTWHRHFNRKVSSLTPPLFIEVSVPSQESEWFSPSTFD